MEIEHIYLAQVPFLDCKNLKVNFKVILLGPTIIFIQFKPLQLPFPVQLVHLIVSYNKRFRGIQPVWLWRSEGTRERCMQIGHCTDERCPSAFLPFCLCGALACLIATKSGSQQQSRVQNGKKKDTNITLTAPLNCVKNKDQQLRKKPTLSHRNEAKLKIRTRVCCLVLLVCLFVALFVWRTLLPAICTLPKRQLSSVALQKNVLNIY